MALKIQLLSASFIAFPAVLITLKWMKEKKLNLLGLESQCVWSQLTGSCAQKQGLLHQPAHQRALSTAIRLPFKLSSQKEDIS
jgi:hypothetical protein